MTLGQRIQKERLRLGLSQEGLGEKVGVSRQAVSKWEADGAVPDTDKLIALSKLFGVTLNELLQVETPPAPGPEASPADLERQDPPPVRRRAGPPILAAACLLLAAALGVSLAVSAARGDRTRDLEERVAALEARALELGERAAALEGKASALEDRVAVLEKTREGQDSASPVADWEISLLEEVRGIRVEVIVARRDEAEDLEVFFQLSGGDLPVPRQVEAQAEPGVSGVYTGDLPFTGNGGTLVVGFRRDGVEDLVPLARDVRVGLSGDSMTYEQLWP